MDVQFRNSMIKFDSADDRFCVVKYSKPYTIGRLNIQIVILLSALGVRDEVFLKKNVSRNVKWRQSCLMWWHMIQGEYYKMLETVLEGIGSYQTCNLFWPAFYNIDPEEAFKFLYAKHEVDVAQELFEEGMSPVRLLLVFSNS